MGGICTYKQVKMYRMNRLISKLIGKTHDKPYFNKKRGKIKKKGLVLPNACMIHENTKLKITF